MNQILIGSFLAKKRKEKNMTQAVLAERLGVSNKTISKWETGKCIPDYNRIEPLCKVLKITVPELLDGEEKAGNSVRVYDEAQILDLIKRTQSLEQQRRALILAMMEVRNDSSKCYLLCYLFFSCTAHDKYRGIPIKKPGTCRLLFG